MMHSNLDYYHYLELLQSQWLHRKVIQKAHVLHSRSKRTLGILHNYQQEHFHLQYLNNLRMSYSNKRYLHRFDILHTHQQFLHLDILHSCTQNKDLLGFHLVNNNYIQNLGTQILIDQSKQCEAGPRTTCSRKAASNGHSHLHKNHQDKSRNSY